MPIDNLGRIHFSPEQIQVASDALDTAYEALAGLSVNLNADERRKYGKVAEKNKLIIEKARDYRQTKPDMASPEVDWEEFERDYQDRRTTVNLLQKISQLEILLTNIKILRDYDNYTAALRDYQYSKYKNRFENQTGYQAKIEQMKVLFPKTGKFKNQKKDE